MALFVGYHGWPAKKILGFTWSKKAEVTLETKRFWQDISNSIFKFSPFLSINSYQFFKIYKHFDKKREKTFIQQSMGKEKLRKIGLCFITGCFIKTFKMIINHFFFISQAHSQRNYGFLISGISKGEIGNGK